MNAVLFVQCIDGAVTYGWRHSYLTGSNCIFMSSMPVVIDEWREMTRKYAITLHSCIPVTDKIKINEQNKSIVIVRMYRF